MAPGRSASVAAMRHIISVLLVPALLLASARAPAPINAVVGDASWVERYGRLPTDDERALDRERHVVHLEWIERKLRARDVSHLSSEQRAMRARLLDALAEYTRRAEFPVNDPGVG